MGAAALTNCAQLCVCVCVSARARLCMCVWVRGLAGTGYIITAAGTIMALAFFGLMLSRISSLNMARARRSFTHAWGGGALPRAVAMLGVSTDALSRVAQFGFYLVAAVLFDTFVVRTLVVPALMGFLNDWNWWPGAPGAAKAAIL